MDFEEDFLFDDQPVSNPMKYPAWFKDSLMDFQEDLAEATDQNKFGLMVYFGQENCPYCRQLLEVNFNEPEISQYTQQHFDVVKINIWHPTDVTDPNGKALSERAYALREETNFTPSLLFYDQQGEMVFKLRGYYPPYQFRAALEYVADRHYQKEGFKDYLARAEGVSVFETGELNEESFFTQPPYQLDRSKLLAEKPLAVFFEQGECHACDILHSEALTQPKIIEHLDNLDTVQLDMWAKTPVITPSGEKLTAQEWSRQLGIFYAPSIVFFDQQGKHILTLDSVAHFNRLNNVLKYISSKAYIKYPKFQQWRLKHRQ